MAKDDTQSAESVFPESAGYHQCYCGEPVPCVYVGLAEELGRLLEKHGWTIMAHDNMWRPDDVKAALARWRATTARIDGADS
jgi:hypothetical protein